MKKAIISLLSIVAVLGSLFAFADTTEAGGGRHIKLLSSTGSWSMTEGGTMTVYADVYPVSADVTDIYIYLDNRQVAHCTDRITCSYRISGQTVGSHNLYAYAVDSDFNYYYVNSNFNFYQYFTVNAREVARPTVSAVTLTQKGSALTGTTGTKGIFIEARAKGTNLKNLKITRTDDSRRSTSVSCERMQSLCALGIYPTFSASEAGKTYTYQAVATDANGNVQYSEKMTVKVVGSASNNPSTPSGNLNPTITVSPNATRIDADETITLRGNASNSNGIWGIEVRAQPSWTNTPVTKRCILNNEPTTGSCSLDIGPFRGHEGDTVKVWTIYWDAETGLGYTSEQKTITLTGTSDEMNDGEFSLTAFAPRFIGENERVNFTARTSMIDDNGRVTDHTSDQIKIYVNGRLTRTCYNASTCTYTGGPFGSLTHNVDSVSYYAVAWDGDEYDSTPTSYSYID